MSAFDVAFERTVGIEKGYVNDPNDPGGETNWGISKRAYPNVDIKNLTKDGAKAIYKRDYWDKLGLDSVPPAVAYQVFDFAVNSGVSVAQRALAAFPGPDAIRVANLLAYRLNYMTGLANWPVAGKGWARRIALNLGYAAADLSA